MADTLMAITSIVLVIVAVSFVVLVRGALSELRKIGQASEDVSRLAATVEKELAPTTAELRETLDGISGLADQLAHTARRIDRVASSAEGLLDTSIVGDTATKVVKSSTASILSVYEGVKQGIKTLRGS